MVPGFVRTLRSLLNEIARLTVLNTDKRASSSNRDLKVVWLMVLLYSCFDLFWSQMTSEDAQT